MEGDWCGSCNSKLNYEKKAKIMFSEGNKEETGYHIKY